jgi:hypothetical protein
MKRQKLTAVSEDWDSPYSFFNSVYQVKDSAGNVQREITGGTGRFLGVW